MIFNDTRLFIFEWPGCLCIVLYCNVVSPSWFCASMMESSALDPYAMFMAVPGLAQSRYMLTHMAIMSCKLHIIIIVVAHFNLSSLARVVVQWGNLQLRSVSWGRARSQSVQALTLDCGPVCCHVCIVTMAWVSA